MAFNSFKALGDVAKMFRLRSASEEFCRVIDKVAPDAAFRERIHFVLAERLYEPSEAARCETLIYPVLHESWRQYRPTLRLWSHIALEFDTVLTGTPDYLIAQQSEFGVSVLDKPILVAVEAKQDDFALGWGQCAAEMVAAQKINGEEVSRTVFGIVTNGEVWQFGKLEGAKLTRNIASYNISDLDTLFGVLSFVMEECHHQVLGGGHANAMS